MKISLMFFLSIKRYVRHPGFVLFLMMIPVLALCSSFLEKSEEEGVSVAFYLQDDSEVSERLRSDLLDYEGMFDFCAAQSEEEVKQRVASQKSDCGFVFDKDFVDRIAGNDFSRTVTVWSSPATTTAGMAEEVIFGHFLKIYGREIIKDYVPDNGAGAVLERYEEHLKDGSTFGFRYENIGGKVLEHNSGKTMPPVRQLIAVFLFITGIFLSAEAMREKEKGLYKRLDAYTRFGCMTAYVAAPLLLTGLACWMGIMTLNERSGGWEECLLIFLYGFLILLFSMIWGSILRTSKTVMLSIPLWIIACLVFCPVFIRAGNLVPELSIFSKFCLPNLYLLLAE